MAAHGKRQCFTCVAILWRADLTECLQILSAYTYRCLGLLLVSVMFCFDCSLNYIYHLSLFLYSRKHLGEALHRSVWLSDILMIRQPCSSDVPLRERFFPQKKNPTFAMQVGGYFFLNRREIKSGEKEKFHVLMRTSVFSGLFEFMWFCFYFYLFCLNECSLLLYLEFIFQPRIS